MACEFSRAVVKLSRLVDGDVLPPGRHETRQPLSRLMSPRKSHPVLSQDLSSDSKINSYFPLPQFFQKLLIKERCKHRELKTHSNIFKNFSILRI